MRAIHPSVAVFAALKLVEDGFRKAKCEGLSLFTSLIRKKQAEQDAVSKEVIREMGDCQKVFDRIIADGVVTAEEREELFAKFDEIKTELTEGRVIPN